MMLRGFAILLMCSLAFAKYQQDIPRRDVSEDGFDTDVSENTNTQGRCNGNSCMKTSCQGQCNSCPSGRCCDGINCNICHEGGCCQSKTCNSCFRQCRSNCVYSSCYSNCYNGCLEGKPACTSNGNTCNKPTSTKTKNNNNKININTPSLNSKRIYNVTTLINITNLINNTNEVDAPVNVNNTNMNSFDVNYTIPNSHNAVNEDTHCCYVVHPLKCTNGTNGKQCYRRKDKVCGAICFAQNPGGNPVFHRNEHPSPQPLQQRSKCYSITHYPYNYCPLESESSKCRPDK